MKYNYYYFDKLLSNEKCSLISQKMREHSNSNIVERAASHTPKRSNVLMTEWRHVKEELSEIEDLIQQVNQNVFAFDIYNFCNSDIINLNHYDSKDKGEYSWHCDGTMNELFDFKLTVVLNISNQPYTGGHLEIFDQRPMRMESMDNPGSVIMFPSYLQHRVTPVTSGQRTSLSMWIKGPLLR